MQSEEGSPTVPVAQLGVSPNKWGGRFHSRNCAPRRLLPARRRDAYGNGRDDSAPHVQLRRWLLRGTGSCDFDFRCAVVRGQF